LLQLDIVIGNLQTPNQIFFGNGKGNFTESKSGTFVAGKTMTYALAIGDFDRDGRNDIVV
jgi:hypothetical protein